MRKTFFLLVITLFSTVIVLAQKIVKPVYFFGKMKSSESSIKLENFSELQYMISDVNNPVIEIKKDSSFAIRIDVKEPTYYRFHRNKLYLSPGDSLEVFIDPDNSSNSWFKGRGADANNYLRDVPYPKGGSYLEAGRNIQATPEETLSFIINKANERRKDLNALKNVSNNFRLLENARINSDILISINKLNAYLNAKLSKSNPVIRDNYNASFYKLAKPLTDSILKGFTNVAFLQIESYRDLYDKLMLDETVDPKAVQIFKDFSKGNKLAFSKIKNESDKGKIAAYKLQADSINTKKYRDAVNQLIVDKLKFGNGDPAIDILVNTTNGKKEKLSSLKGKVIYIDLWATWCGPCLAEMPNFEKLKEKYKGNDKIAFVSLSVDDTDKIWLDNLKVRKPEGIQWRIDRANLFNYEVLSIPRYILIDKDFKIKTFYAERAADNKLHQKLEQMLR